MWNKIAKKIRYNYWVHKYLFTLNLKKKLLKYFDKEFNPKEFACNTYWMRGNYMPPYEDCCVYVLFLIATCKAKYGKCFNNAKPVEFWNELCNGAFMMHPMLKDFTTGCLQSYSETGDDSVNSVCYKIHYRHSRTHYSYDCALSTQDVLNIN